MVWNFQTDNILWDDGEKRTGHVVSMDMSINFFYPWKTRNVGKRDKGNDKIVLCIFSGDKVEQKIHNKLDGWR